MRCFPLSSRAQRGLCCSLVAVFVLAASADAQRTRRGGVGGGLDRYFSDPNEFYTPPGYSANPPYDGRFTFARIKYRGMAHFTEEGPGWAHDYPRADVHLMKLMKELTSMRPFVEKGPITGGAIISMDDPLIFRYPVAYLSEPGGWSPNQKEIEGLRNSLPKGGFIIVDDFGRNDIYRLSEILRAALPKLQMVKLDASHPIFDSFYKIGLDVIQQTYYGTPEYYGVFEDNDPKKRLMMIINYNNDIGEYWEFSDEGFNPVALTNEAYKLGINYLIYSLTH
jgi:hypothetical protein